jgi:hypothetical protein
LDGYREDQHLPLNLHMLKLNLADRLTMIKDLKNVV